MDIAPLWMLAALNLAPGIVALVPSRAVPLYGVALDGPALALAMRHRAVLLALVGVLLALAALDAAWLAPALLVAGVSKLSFLGLFLTTGPHGAPMRRIALADAFALVALCGVVVLRFV
jgi:hypothetical protein